MAASGNWCYSIWIILGSVYFLLPKKRVGVAEKISIFFLGAGMVLGIFIGGTTQLYYGLPLAAFSVFGGIIFIIFMEKVTEKTMWHKRVAALLCLLTLLVGGVEGYYLSSNTYLLKVEREEMPQYRFKTLIEASDDESLLNYGFLDGGFYTVLDVVPSMKYYCTLNVNYDRILAEQNLYVEQKMTEWLVTWKAFEMPEEELQKLPVVSEYYELVDYQYFYFEGDKKTYALFRRK